jgi:peptidoglycan/LPS O-acetylase OafA/YrhL
VKDLRIQTLRGVSILAVLAFHLSNKFPLGYLGVDVFFVISGFVMAPRIMKLIETRENNLQFKYSELLIFFDKRFRRLSPALGFGLILTALATFLFADPHDLHRISMQGIFTIFLIGNIGSQRYAGDYFQPNPIPLIHTWSLSAEEQIYILVPALLILVIFIITSKKFPWFRFFLSLFLISLFGEFFLVNILNSKFGENWPSEFLGYYSPLTHLWQFCLGALLYLISINQSARLKLPKVQLSKIPWVLMILLLLNPFGKLGENLTLFLLVMLTSCILLDTGRSIRAKTSIKPLVLIGNLSYSLYIFHLPVIYFFIFSPSVQRLSLNSGMRTILTVITFFVFSIACYFLIEKRSIQYKTRTLFFTWTVFPVLLFLGVNGLSNYVFEQTITPSSSTKSYSASLECYESSESVCHYQGKNLQKSVLILGDSHARALAGSIVSSEKITDEAIFLSLNDGCRFSLPIFGGEESCASANDATLSWIKRNNPKLIIVTGRAIGDEGKSWNRRQVEFLASYNVILRESEADLIVVGPNLEFSPVDYFQTLSGHLTEFDVLSQKENAFLKPEIERLANKRIEFVDPNTYLCVSGCTRASLLKFYFDNDHLNSQGTDKVVRTLGPMIVERLG